MNRLMRAEWHRIMHSSKLKKWLAALCVICTVLPILVDVEVLKGNLTENLMAAQLAMSVFIPGFLSVFAAITVGIGYMNKTVYYEVMAGNKIYQIAFSKVLVDAVIIAGSVFASMGIYWIIIGYCNGVGEIGQLPLRLILLFLLFLHVCTSGVLIMTSFRQILGAVFVYVRFAVAETSIMFVVQLFEEQFSETMMSKIADWFTMLKLTKLLSAGYEVTGHLIFAVIAGMLIENGIWFGISYIGMKKRIYK